MHPAAAKLKADETRVDDANIKRQDAIQVQGVEPDTPLKMARGSYFPPDADRKMDLDFHRIIAGNENEWGVVNAPVDTLKSVMKERLANEERMKFHQYILQANGDATPEQLARLEEIIPDLFKDREEWINDTMDILKRWELIQLRGPRTTDEWVLVYMVHTGRVKIPKVVHDGDEKTRYNRAPWNPRQRTLYNWEKTKLPTDYMDLRKNFYSKGSSSVEFNAAGLPNTSWLKYRGDAE